MKTKFYFFLAMLLTCSMGAFAQSGSGESPKGDLNNDGKVDAADIVTLVNIITNGGEAGGEAKYYWYVGAENPTSISNIQTDISTAGWHEIGTSVPSDFIVDLMANPIKVSETRINYYVVIPNSLHVYAADGTTNVENTYFKPTECNIDGYKAFVYDSDVGTRNANGIILK